MDTLERPAPENAKRAAADTPPPVAAEAEPLYASRQQVYPKDVHGRVRWIKWAVLIACLAPYYTVPWLRWDRGAGLPDQAVLVDITNARIFLFSIEIWPQEIYFLTGMLVLAAIALFAVTSLFGRLWCGFACPQTVWTDLFIWVERKIQGDRNARMKLDRGPHDGAYWSRKLATHGAWLLIAAATGGAWIMYFVDAPTAAREIITGQASTEVYFFFGLFTLTTYLLAGWAREQVCTYMCPWPRFQAAMLDENTLVVSYRAWRGEPRGKPKAEGVGDCVDCMACVHVCPTGIDIRDGQQLECIGCGLCVDACDDVMRKLGRPTGLVAFETLKNLVASEVAAKPFSPGPQRFAAGMQARHVPRFIRARTLLYAGVLSAVALVMLGAFLLRDTLTITVLHDRQPLFVPLSDGGVRNGYTVKLVNKTRDEPMLALTVQAPRGVTAHVADAPLDASGRPLLSTSAGGVSQARIFLTAEPGLRLDARTPVTFRLADPSGRIVASAETSFHAPENTR
jgi:cytochrome c oxidase accessory protein FixG